MAPDTSQLQKAIAAIKAGDRVKGRKLLSFFLQDNPIHENALLWLSATTDNPTEKRRYFERVLLINPANEKAKQALAKLDTAEESELEMLTDGRAQPAPVQVVVATPPKPAWRYWANLLIVAGGIFGCIICVLYVTAG